jgi:hypothetical protein
MDISTWGPDNQGQNACGGLTPHFWAPCDIPTWILQFLASGDGKARPEYRYQEPESGEWDCHVFDRLESPAQSPRHDTVQSGRRKLVTLARLDRDLSLRD